MSARRLEAAALFLGAPLMIALFLPPTRMFAALAAFTLLGLWLLGRSNYDWRQALRSFATIRWGIVAATGLATVVVGLAVLALTGQPVAGLLREQPWLLAMIWLFYPLVSALPQELIFRALFFRRYASTLGSGAAIIWMNAAVFSLAHLMYWNPVALALTFGGGLAFALAYRAGGLGTAWAAHGLAGNLLFTLGLGPYFYSGNIIRPF